MRAALNKSLADGALCFWVICGVAKPRHGEAEFRFFSVGRTWWDRAGFPRSDSSTKKRLACCHALPALVRGGRRDRSFGVTKVTRPPGRNPARCRAFQQRSQRANSLRNSTNATGLVR